MKTVLVTGGAGFIGSSLVDRLLYDGYKVVIVDNLDDMYYDPEIKRGNIESFLNNDNVSFYEIDIRDFDKMDEIFAKHKPNYVVHLAAKVDTRMALDYPDDYINVNILGTLNILKLAKKYDVENTVSASSSSVYGNTSKPPFSEDEKVSNPLSAYGTSKIAGELLAYNYHHNYGLNVTCLRYFNAYGERMRPALVMTKWINTILNNETIEMSGDGERARDYTYIGDIVSGTIKAMEKPLGYEVINIGNSSSISLNNLLSTIESVLDRKATIKRRPSHKASVEHTFADVSKAERLLKWKPETSIEEGLTKLVSWVRNQRG